MDFLHDHGGARFLEISDVAAVILMMVRHDKNVT